tara:strand:+ start:1405 stop:2331 length:927 start_codon:yes stop_codon:yes gene_type:complete
MLNNYLSLNSFKNIENTLNVLKKNILFIRIKKYLSILLIPLFIAYIIIALNRSEVNIFNFQTFKFTIIFLFLSFLISPIFIITKSTIYHSLKKLLGLKSSLRKSINSVLFASSLDVFTPAKINDFARLKGEENKKLALYAIFIERFLDISTLSIFVFFNNYFYSLTISIFILFILSNFLYLLYKSLFKYSNLIIGSLVISIFHWLIAFKLFKASFEIILNSLNFSQILTIMDSITLNKFSIVTILGVLPISVGGIGIREAAAIKIFDKIDPSVVFASAVIYGLAVSGSLSLLGIIYVNLKQRFPRISF